MPWKRHHSLLLLLAVVLGIVGWWGASRADEDSGTPPVADARPTARPPRPAASPDEPEPTRTPDGTRAWVPGQQFRYAVDTTQQVTFVASQAGAQVPPGMRFHVQGEWRVGITGARDTGVEARAALLLTDLSVTVEGRDALEPQMRAALTTSLALPIFLTMERTGAVRTVHVEPGLDVLAQGILRSLVASTQFVVAGAPKESWESDEQDATGLYRAAYRRLGAKRFEKSKRGYTHVATSQGLQEVDASKLRLDARTRAVIDVGDDVWPELLEGDEQLGVDAGDGMPKVSHSLHVSLKLLERGRDSTLVGLLDRERSRLTAVPLASFQSAPQDPKEQYRRLLAGKRFDDLVKDLRSLPKDEKERDDARTHALEQLRALFLLEPKEAAKVPGLLHEGMEPLAASPMLGALSAASTPEALSALSKVVDDAAVGVPVRTDAVAALGMAETPSTEGIQALRDLGNDTHPELRDTAALALGNSAFQLRDDDASGADALSRELGTRYRAAKSPEDQALLLRALGNTRDPGALTTLREALASPSVPVRQAAVEALRLVPEAEADRLLASRMLEDPSPDVRKSAVFAASFRALPPLLPTLGTVLQRDTADAVRAAVVGLLGANLGALPQALPLLTWTSQHDTNPNIRQSALGFLGALASAQHP
ncbi:HEAT repeat domain-containing protein [Corallococcus sp. M34]|uniref:HEAT repeat domain-containing protein n=1 Tax=Citreicoccus inhibens TaxID=2849499 RepID=UPI001C22A63E|nr:HEAT repeat domain-containing protein [Citreicoccus inhibens]MBU8898132.1 HEAT repeat domain-containing protein [Citreicoccus inhibens]